MLLSLLAPATANAATISATNGFYKIFMSSNGQYTVQTDTAHPQGGGHNILYGNGTPGSSFSTIRSYDSHTDYVQGSGTGDSAGFTRVSLDPYASVGQVDDQTLRATYALPGPGGSVTPATPDTLTVQEDLVVYGSSADDSGVELLTTIAKQGSTTGHFGVRNFFDYQLGTDDGPTYQQLAPNGPVMNTESQSPPSFQYYRMTDHGPTYSVLGSLTGPNAPAGETPDLIQYQCYPSARPTAFDYTVTSSANCASDSAVSIFWGDTQAHSHSIEAGGRPATFSSTFVATAAGGTFPPGSIPPGPRGIGGNSAPAPSAGPPESPGSSPSGGKSPTGTQVICNLDLQTTFRDTCTATVGGGATLPTGSVDFFVVPHSGTRGDFVFGRTCQLAPSPRSFNVSSCAVQFTPASTRFPHILASYRGDGAHNHSSDVTRLRGILPGQRLPGDYLDQPEFDNNHFRPGPDRVCPPPTHLEGDTCVGAFSNTHQEIIPPSTVYAHLSDPAVGQTTPSRWAISSRQTSRPKGTRKGPRGTRVRYKLKGPAAVRFTVIKLTKGRTAGKGRCVKPTHKNRKGKNCARHIRVRGSFTVESTAGANQFLFYGWIGRRKLKPGKYLLVATPSLQGARGRAVSSTPFRLV